MNELLWAYLNSITNDGYEHYKVNAPRIVKTIDINDCMKKKQKKFNPSKELTEINENMNELTLAFKELTEQIQILNNVMDTYEED